MSGSINPPVALLAALKCKSRAVCGICKGGKSLFDFSTLRFSRPLLAGYWLESIVTSIDFFHTTSSIFEIKKKIPDERSCCANAPGQCGGYYGIFFFLPDSRRRPAIGPACRDLRGRERTRLNSSHLCLSAV